jgi:hypothetical protein
VSDVIDSVWFLVVAIIYLAILVLLVRPSSQGPNIVTTIFDAFSDLLKGSTGYGNQT